MAYRPSCLLWWSRMEIRKMGWDRPAGEPQGTDAGGSFLWTVLHCWISSIHGLNISLLCEHEPEGSPLHPHLHQKPDLARTSSPGGRWRNSCFRDIVCYFNSVCQVTLKILEHFTYSFQQTHTNYLIPFKCKCLWFHIFHNAFHFMFWAICYVLL